MSGRSRGLVAATVAYTLMLAYGTLYPLQGWRVPEGGLWSALTPAWPVYQSRSDLAANLFVYLPLGALAYRCIRARASRWLSVTLATVAGSTLSLLLEMLQGLLPTRVPSIADLAANAAGSAIGAAALASVSRTSGFGRAMAELRHRWIVEGRLANLGLSVLGLWALSQLAPLVPSADFGDLKQGLKPLWRTLRDPRLFDLQHAGVYAFAVSGLGLLSATIARSRRPLTGPFVAFVAAVLALKVPVVTRQLSAEALAGVAAAAAALVLLGRVSPIRCAAGGAVLVLMSYLLDGLRVEGEVIHHALARSMNWVPLENHVTRFVPGLIDLIGGAWTFLGAGYMARIALGERRRRAKAWAGGSVVLIVAMLVELTQRTLPGRSPDITDVLVALIAWLIPWSSTFAPEDAGLLPR